MTTWMILLALLLLAGPASVQAADTKASPPTTDATGATFTVTWTGGSAPWSAGFNDGSAAQKGTGASPLTLRMPYHASGAATSGYVCALGSCAALPVPAKSATPPPGTTTHSLIYTEPKTNPDSTPLTDLASIRAYYRVNNGAEAMATYPVSSPTGGTDRTNSLTVPATSGTLTVAVAAVDTAGNESVRTPVVSKVIGGVTPPPPPPPPPPPADCNPAGIAVSVPVPVGGKVVTYSGVLRCAP